MCVFCLFIRYIQNISIEQRGLATFDIYLHHSVRTILQLIQSSHFIGKLGPPRRYQSKEMLDFVFTGTVCWDETRELKGMCETLPPTLAGPIEVMSFLLFLLF